MEQLRGIAEGRAPLTGRVARTVLDLVRELAPHSPESAAGPSRLHLTEREQDVLRCLVRGRSYGHAAEDLGVSLDTVRSHVKSVYKKLQVHSVADAVRRALKEDLV
jgi:DNA-binding NarL/FixJ family response regulator